MKFIKNYKCSKCEHSFTKIIQPKFIVGTMPQCPICGSSEIQIENRIEKKREK